jgi:hypothetical protein
VLSQIGLSAEEIAPEQEKELVRLLQQVNLYTMESWDGPYPKPDRRNRTGARKLEGAVHVRF